MEENLTNVDKKVHLIANAHLDPIWLWRWQEGCGEVLQTFSAACDRLDEYDDFIFTCSSASYYAWVEEIDPNLFARITKFVKEGRWVPVNGWWVQPDCNMPSGESFARQALYSQLFYYEKFGKICRTGYNVDSFGHNGMLPQLLRQGGMNAYVFMRPEPHENNNIPQNAFWWDSQDGSRVLAYRIPAGYGCDGKHILEKVDFYNKRVNDTGYGLMLFYGAGNHGGGPTRYDINLMVDNMKREGYNELAFSSPDAYFESILKSKLELPVWTDDFQHHASGCYSATGEVKKLNRYAENLLASAEKFDTVVTLTTDDLEARTKEFNKAWKDVLFNQFHDIFCGCSIMEAYDDVRESEGHAMTIAARAYNRACLRIARKIDTWIDGASDPVCTEVRHHGSPRRLPRPVVVFNPLSWEVNVPVQTYHPSDIVKDSNGNLVPFQNVRSSRSNDSHLDTVFLAKVPALGYATYWLWHLNASEENGAVKTDIRLGELSLENSHVFVRFDQKSGFITAMVNKETGVNLLSGSQKLMVIDDHEADTWAHNIFTFHNVKGYMTCESIDVIERGPARAVIRAKYRFNDSTLNCDYILGTDQKTLEVKCKAFWREPHTMLKVCFPVKGTNPISTYEIPCGWIKRPCNGEEEPGQQWADITLSNPEGARNGLSFMSDSKYSFDIPGDEIRLTLIRNAIFADHYSYRPAADFNYTDEGISRFSYGVYLHAGEAEESDVVREATQFQVNNRPVTVPESYHHSDGEPLVKSFISLSAENVIVTALKYCEDGSGDVIIRAYETRGKDTRAEFVVKAANASFASDFGPHQIKTFRVAHDGSVSEVNFLEGIVK